MTAAPSRPTAELFEAVVESLRLQAVEAYMIGGAVRDVLSGRCPDDLDIVVADDAEAVALCLGETTSARIVVIDDARGYFRLVPPDDSSGWVDISGRDGTLTSDLARRDFTINAIALNVSDCPPGLFACPSVPPNSEIRRLESRLIDPMNGLPDLRSRTLRAISRQNLLDDPVRLIRGPRIANQLGFMIEPGTKSMIRMNASSLVTTAPERVRDELFSVFANSPAERGLRLLDALGLLDVVFPEIRETRGVTQPREHHYWDVFEHLLHSVGRAEALIDRRAGESDLTIRMAPWRREIEGHFDEVVSDGQSRATLLKVTALLHDIAKPRHKTVDADGRTRFLGHDEAGADMARGMLLRLRCSSRTVTHVSQVVRHHMRPSHIGATQGGVPPSPRALFRYWRDLGDVAVDTLFLSLADYLAARGPEIDMKDWSRFAGVAGVILADGFVTPMATKPFLLLNGHELMKEFGLHQGRRVGELLTALQSAEAEGKVQTREDAAEFIRVLISQQDRNSSSKLPPV